MERVFQGTCKLRSLLSTAQYADDQIRTPYGLDVSLPNKERGTFHIEKGNYWKFYNLEFVYLRHESCRHD
jgi:hypothetical protein